MFSCSELPTSLGYVSNVCAYAPQRDGPNVCSSASNPNTLTDTMANSLPPIVDAEIKKVQTVVSKIGGPNMDIHLL